MYELTVLDFYLKGKSEVAYSTEHTKWLDGNEKGETVKGLPCKCASGNYATFNYLFIYVGTTPIATNREDFLHTFIAVLLLTYSVVLGRRRPLSHKDIILFNILQDLVESTPAGNYVNCFRASDIWSLNMADIPHTA
jgi:hypothetical protein